MPLEKKRLYELEQLEILDTPNEKEFDDLVELAARICDTPISLISLVGKDRQWFKAKKGIAISETDLSGSFCADALTQKDLVVISDTRTNPRYSNNDMVKGDPNIRFYAGSQIISPNGFTIGILCVIDIVPKDLNWQQASALKALSQQASKLIELHYRNIQLKVLQKKVLDKEESKRKMIDQKVQISHLCQIENSILQSFFNKNLEPLRTGKFTKKELSELYYRSQRQARQTNLFNEIIALIQELQDFKNINKTEEFNVAELINLATEEINPILKEFSNKIIVDVSVELKAIQYVKPLSIILRAIITSLASFVKKREIHVVAIQTDNDLEIRISIVDEGLTEKLYKYDPNDLVSIRSDPDSIYLGFAAVQILVNEVQGRMKILKFGKSGTTIVVDVPDYRSEMSLKI